MPILLISAENAVKSLFLGKLADLQMGSNALSIIFDPICATVLILLNRNLLLSKIWIDNYLETKVEYLITPA